jgi:hypothetical protein
VDQQGRVCGLRLCCKDLTGRKWRRIVRKSRVVRTLTRVVAGPVALSLAAARRQSVASSPGAVTSTGPGDAALTSILVIGRAYFRRDAARAPRYRGVRP